MDPFDVAIAGGGLIGASIALELAQAGLQVGLFDRQKPGEEASWAAAGILSPAPENPGALPMVPLARASMSLYPDFVADVEEISGQNVGYHAKGTVEALFSGDARAKLNTIIAVHHGLGLKAEALSTEDARRLEPALSEEMEAAVLRPEEAAVDNRALTAATLVAAERAGAKIFAGSQVQAISRDGERCAGVIVDQGRIAARWTVIAAGCFSAQIEGVQQYAPVRPAKGQMIALRISKVDIERVLWSEKVYLVPRGNGRVLAGATVEYVGFEKNVNAGAIQKILTGAVELAPCIAEAKIEETWAGLRPDAPDHLPIIGPTDLDGLLIATGHFRSGILLAPITARLIHEWITRQSVSVDWGRCSPMRFAESAKATGN
jgi:glycine oxidase